MYSASLRSLTPLLDGIDRWVELAPLLPIIISLELVLSADNAVALASITKNLNNIELQKKALNVGIFISLLLRILVILTAQFFLNFWSVKLIGGIYLILLSFSKLTNINNDSSNYGDLSNRKFFFQVERRAYSLGLIFEEVNKQIFIGFKLFDFSNINFDNKFD